MSSKTIKSIIVGALGVATLAACSSGHKKDAQSTPQPSRSATSSSTSKSATSKSASSGRSKSATSGTSKKAPRPTQAAGAEAQTPASQVGICKIADPSDVAAAYGAKVATVTGGTTPIGNTKCLFILSRSNAGVPGTVALTLNASSSPAAFARVKKQAAGAVAVAGVGEGAFYQAATATLQFVKGSSVVAVQADIRVPGEKPADPPQVRADTVALAKTVAAQL